MTEFNFKQFHNNLDIMMALAIAELNLRPSQISLLEFMEYSFSKVKEIN